VRAEPLPLVVGLPRTTIDQSDLDLLERVRPQGVILFDRNVESADQVRGLVGRLEELELRPFVAVDLEGGAVNRLQRLWGALPSPSQAGASGRRAVRALGAAAGAACRSLGIQLDLAPVVDLERPTGAVGREGRCLSSDPERVAVLARVFAEGLAEWGVAGCLKHFPGLGTVAADTHLELPVWDDVEPVDPHLQVFEALSRQIPVVMVAHVIAPQLGDPERPASLSRSLVSRAAGLPGAPVLLSDDLEMGALRGLGDLPELVTAALRARNHGVLVCRAFDRLDEIADAVRSAADADPAFDSRIEDLSSRLGTLRRDLCQNMAAVPAPDDDAVDQLWKEARNALDRS
jgi:beta-N-acetylhexosaminidase